MDGREVLEDALGGVDVRLATLSDRLEAVVRIVVVIGDLGGRLFRLGRGCLGRDGGVVLALERLGERRPPGRAAVLGRLGDGLAQPVEPLLLVGLDRHHRHAELPPQISR